ncbi:MAG: CehA/McbA family metallohydrolase [Polyangiaceae bacterium]
MSSIDGAGKPTPFGIALFSAVFALGIAQAASPHVHTMERSAVVRASGTGRLVTSHAAFAIQPSLGRIAMRAIDGSVDVALDLAIVCDGAAHPVSLSHLEPGVHNELTGDLPIEVADGSIAATLAFRVEGDALAIELRSSEPARAFAHRVAIRVTTPSDLRPLFVSGTGEIADSARTKGAIAMVEDEEHAFGFASSHGEVEAELGFDESEEEPSALRRSIDSPPFSEHAAATDLRVALGTPDALWRELTTQAGIRTARVFGEVTEQLVDAKRSQREVAHARVVGLDEEGKPQLLTFADKSGRFDVSAPINVAMWYAALDATQTSAPIRFSPGTTYALKLDVSPGGELITKIIDGDSKLPITARLIVHGIEGTLDPSFGPDWRASGAGPIIDALRGDVSTPLPAGRYRVCATKGIEYSIDCRELSIEGGHGISLGLELRHVLPTPNLLGCDLHVHARPSFDTLVSSEDRVLSLVAAGIDFAVPTEHNLVGDYAPALASLDLGSELATVRGVEVTTYSPRFGHFGVFPYPGDKPVPPFRHSSINAVFNAAHRGDPNRIVQVNHPRMEKGIGYFSVVGYDPDSAKIPARIRLDFDSIEVYNGYEIQQPTKVEAVLRDYFSLLNRGKKYVATGSSDSHHIQYQWAGYPRTVVDMGSPTSSDKVDPLAVVAAIKAGHAIVTSGPLLEVTANGAHPGDDIQRGADPIVAHVRLRAAPWVDVTSLELVVDGKSVRTFDIASHPTKTGPELGALADVQSRTIRFEQDVPVPIGAGKSWFVFIARGTRKLDDVLPFMPVPPFAMTNPIWVTP